MNDAQRSALTDYYHLCVSIGYTQGHDKLPPHSDYWLQSLSEKEAAVEAAFAMPETLAYRVLAASVDYCGVDAKLLDDILAWNGGTAQEDHAVSMRVDCRYPRCMHTNSGNCVAMVLDLCPGPHIEEMP